jgi:hypothetical protein
MCESKLTYASKPVDLVTFSNNFPPTEMLNVPVDVVRLLRQHESPVVRTSS